VATVVGVILVTVFWPVSLVSGLAILGAGLAMDWRPGTDWRGQLDDCGILTT